MKKVILALLVMLPFISMAQDSLLALSKYEKFIDKTGVMYKTETFRIGKVKDIEVSVLKTTELETNTSVKVVVVKQLSTSLFTVIRYGALYIDMDEIAGVSNALEYYLKAIKEGKPQNDPSYSFITSNDVVASCSYITAPMATGWYVSLSRRYHYLKSIVESTVINFKNKDIDDFIEVMKKAKEFNL